MDYPNHITNHEKGKHLTYEDCSPRHFTVMTEGVSL